MIAYNLNDSKVTCSLWIDLKSGPEITNMCTVSCSPVSDCARYVTGSMSVSLISSQCVVEGSMYPWGECDDKLGFQGGYVMDPIKGIHDDVVVCDFASMYPTILMSGNISVENLTVSRHAPGNFGAVGWDASSVSVDLGSRTASFSLGDKPLTSRVVESLVTERAKFKQTDKHYANALKVMCNSLYGALGYEQNTPLYTPRHVPPASRL